MSFFAGYYNKGFHTEIFATRSNMILRKVIYIGYVEQYINITKMALVIRNSYVLKLSLKRIIWRI